ncbi:ABC transporter permease subunit [bacterium]|nr:ABC transporter permease subunit [bacterium]
MRFNNPVLTREMRARAKGKRSFLVHILFLTFFLFVFLPIYYFVLKSETPWSENSTAFAGLLFSLLGFVSIVSPAFSSGSITGEREQKTLAFLLVSPLKPSSVIFGKVLSSFLFSALLLATTLPLFFLAFTVGGIEGKQFLLSFIIILISSLFFSALALFFSSVSRRTASAIAITYGIILFLLIGTLFIEDYLASRHTPGGNLPYLSGILYLNPAAGLLSTMTEQQSFFTLGSPGKPLNEFVPYKSVPLPFWVVNVILLLLLAYLLMLFAKRRYARMERT